MFDVKCAASGLSIASGFTALVLVANDNGRWAPIAPPLFGDYDSYGSIELPTLIESALATLRGLVGLAQRGTLTLPDGSEFTDAISVANMHAFLEAVRQGPILGAVGSDTWWVRLGGRPLGFVIILSNVYDAIVTTMERASDDWVVAEEALEELPLDDLLLKTLVVPGIARALVCEKSRSDLIELLHVRSWLDEHRSWTPITGGDQPTDVERRAIAVAAKAHLAAWPRLLRAVERYEASIGPT